MAATGKDVKMDWSGHPLPFLKIDAGDTLPVTVQKWRRGAAQTMTAAVKSPWLMNMILSLRSPKSSQTVLNLSQSDGNGSDKFDILAAFEETERTRKIIVGRAMKYKAPISTEKWDDVVKTKTKSRLHTTKSCTISASSTLR